MTLCDLYLLSFMLCVALRAYHEVSTHPPPWEWRANVVVNVLGDFVPHWNIQVSSPYVFHNAP